MLPPSFPPKNIRALKALVRDCGSGWTPPKQGKLRHSPVPSGIEWLAVRLGGGLYRACWERTAGK